MVKISNLPSDSTPTNTDYIVVHDAETGATKKVLLSSLFSQGLIGSTGIADDAITSAKLAGIDKSNLTTDSNPYKFHAYATATQNLTGTTQVLVFESEAYDTNGDYSTSTGRYTAPVTGFYWFYAKDYIQSVNDQIECGIHFYKNGASFINQPTQSSGSYDVRVVISCLMSLVAGDYIQVYTGNNMGTRNHLGYTATGLTTTTMFQGFLVSRT